MKKNTQQPRRTLQEFKDEVAVDNGFANWKDLHYDLHKSEQEEKANEAAERYARHLAATVAMETFLICYWDKEDMLNKIAQEMNGMNYCFLEWHFQKSVLVEMAKRCIESLLKK